MAALAQKNYGRFDRYDAQHGAGALERSVARSVAREVAIDAQAAAQANKEFASFILAGPIIAGSFVFWPVAVEKGGEFIAANTALGSTSSQVIAGGSLGFGYTEASTRIIQGRAPTTGERVFGTLTGGTFGSGLIGVTQFSMPVNAAINSGASGLISNAGAQRLDIELGSNKPFRWKDVFINGGIGMVAGGIGGTVKSNFSTPPIQTGTGFKAGWNFGVHTQLYTLPNTLVSTEVQVHLDSINQAVNPPEQTPLPLAPKTL